MISCLFRLGFLTKKAEKDSSDGGEWAGGAIDERARNGFAGGSEAVAPSCRKRWKQGVTG
jgi:hypothetical protein